MTRHDLTISNDVPSTLADVINIFRADETLTAVQRRDLVSAVRAVARFADLPPGAVMLDVARHRYILENVQPARFRMSDRRMANIRSLFVKALITAGVAIEPLRLEAELSDAWARLRKCGSSPNEVNMMSRFAQHCSINGISPDAVTDQIVAEYLEGLETRSLLRHPRKHVQNLVRTWNLLADRIPGGSDVHLSPIRSREIILLSLTTFPESFQAELQDWLDRLAGRDPLADLRFRPLRAVSVQQHRNNLVRCASVLVHLGRDPAAITGLDCLTDPENAKAVFRWYLKRNGGKPSHQIHNIRCNLQSLARHGLQLGDDKLKPLEAILSRCRMKSSGMTPKNRDTLRAFEDERLIHAFLELPERLMRRALTGTTVSRLDAYTAARALAIAIAILSSAPVRIENLYGIELDRHIVRSGGGRRATMHLVFPAHEVKNDKDIELPLSASATKLLDIYLKRAWPVLAEDGCSYLFPGRSGMKRTKIGLGMAISRTVRRELGIRITPHQFRHLCGFLYLRQYPGDYETVRALLGHKSLQTTVSFYAGMETAAAGRRFDEVVLAPRRRRGGTRDDRRADPPPTYDRRFRLVRAGPGRMACGKTGWRHFRRSRSGRTLGFSNGPEGRARVRSFPRLGYRCRRHVTCADPGPAHSRPAPLLC